MIVNGVLRTGQILYLSVRDQVHDGRLLRYLSVPPSGCSTDRIAHVERYHQSLAKRAIRLLSCSFHHQSPLPMTDQDLQTTISNSGEFDLQQVKSRPHSDRSRQDSHQIVRKRFIPNEQPEIQRDICLRF